MPLQKIISGGQTGVDQAALYIAASLGLETGGWCPPGRICDDGTIPGHYHLRETPVERSSSAPGIPRSLRTEWNVRDADATLVLKPDEITDEGTEWTIQCAVNFKKPYLVINPFSKDAAFKIKSWMSSLKIKTLNVAGPTERTCPGIGGQTKEALLRVLTG